MPGPPVVDYVAATLAFRVEPGSQVVLGFDVPDGYETGTWTASVYRNARQVPAGSPLFAVDAGTFTELESTFTFTADDLSDLITDGAWKFTGWWTVTRVDPGGLPRTWAKGDFVVDPEGRLPRTGSQAISFVLTDNHVSIKGDLADEINNREAADAALQAAINAEAATRAAADTTEAAARVAADAAEASARAAADTTEANTRDAADTAEATTRAAADSAEATTRANADTAEAATRAAADVALQDAIDAEEAERIALGDDLQANIDAEQTAREAADSTEASTRAAADTALQADIDQEATDRTAAVAGEATARANADAAEATARANADTAEATARANADTAEASARLTADTALQADIDQETTDRTAAVAAEAATRTAADTTLQAAIDQEADDRADDIAAEAVIRSAGDDALQTALTAEAVARAAGDATLQTAVDDEAATRLAADTDLQTAIDVEESARSTADTVLQTAVDDEATARAAGDSDEAAARLAADAAEATTRGDADTTEAAARAAADTTLQTNLTAEAAARAAADTAEAAARLVGDAAVQAAVDGEVANRLADVGAEAAARAAADVAATAALATETADRIAGDAAEAATRASADSAIVDTVVALDAATLKKDDNLSDVTSASQARSNLELHQLPAPAMRSGRWYRVPAMATLATGVPDLDTVTAMPKFVVSTIVVERLGAEVTSAGSAGAVVRLGIWADDGTGRPGTLLLDAGTIDGTSATVQSLTVSQELTRGWYWFGAAPQVATSTLRTTGTPSETVHLDLAGTPTAGQVACAFTATGAIGAFGDFTVADVAATGVAMFVRCGPTGTFSALREDSGFVLREDGFHMLREDD